MAVSVEPPVFKFGRATVSSGEMKEDSATSSNEPNFDFSEAPREEKARRDEMRAIEEGIEEAPEQ